MWPVLRKRRFNGSLALGKISDNQPCLVLGRDCCLNQSAGWAHHFLDQSIAKGQVLDDMKHTALATADARYVPDPSRMGSFKCAAVDAIHWVSYRITCR